MPGSEFDAVAATFVIIGAMAATILWALALWDTRRLTLRRLWREWHSTSERRR